MDFELLEEERRKKNSLEGPRIEGLERISQELSSGTPEGYLIEQIKKRPEFYRRMLKDKTILYH